MKPSEHFEWSESDRLSRIEAGRPKLVFNPTPKFAADMIREHEMEVRRGEQ
jgi:hypothetical protein